MTTPVHTCRFCKQWVYGDIGVHYSIRCWAHYGCYLEHRGLKGLEPWKIARIPPPLLSRHGLFADACRIIDTWKLQREYDRKLKELKS